MARFALKLILCLLVALAAGFGYLALRSGDALYSFYEWVSPARFQQYDKLILSVAAEHQLDPMLVKAVVWRESRFDRQKYGTAGERGLMQVSEKAANEWARERKIDNFQVDQLFDPKTNLEAGSWYLRRALDHWQNESEPLPFALAEYKPRSALGWSRWNHEQPISWQHRFPRYAQIRSIDSRSLRFLQNARPNVSWRSLRRTLSQFLR